uniref:hypothetical protein n=1 Tax=Clostridium sp. HBUAS56017 TaxID=2571128 RepID=UPI001178B8C8
MGKIEFDREDLAKKSRELMNLKRDINNILSGTKGTDKVLNRASKVSTMIQKRKLQELQNYAYNIVKEFDKL